MSSLDLGVIGAVLTLGLIALRVPIAFAFLAVGIGCLVTFFAASPTGVWNFGFAFKPTLTLAMDSTFELFQSYNLTAVPMFVALGHVAYRAGITGDIYLAARTWLTRVPGGLAMASIVGCGGFSAISGSSLACAATMGRVAVPEMRKYGYDDRLASGAVAAGGTLGSLIPPSVLFIIFGVFTESSISKLFIAGIVPGLISMAGYWIVIAIWSRLRPHHAPSAVDAYGWRDRARTLAASWPAVAIFVIIIGGIYGGVFSPTEAAAASFVVTAVIALALRRITWRAMLDCVRETLVQTAAIFLIGAAAQIFVSFVALTGVAHTLVDMVQAADPGPTAILLGVVAIYLVLGMFLDPLGILLLTLPFVVPLVERNGYDLIWFGVIVVKLLEMGLMTPPVGLNVFVINSVTSPRIPVGRIFAGVAPFFVSDLVVLAMLVIFPGLSLWLTTAL